MSIKRRADLSAEETANVDQWIRQHQPQPFAKFDQFGLRFDLKWLKFAKCTVILLPLEDMALYADRVTTDALAGQNESFLERQSRHVPQNEDTDFAAVNATALGNLAAIVLQDPSEARKRIALGYLTRVYDWHTAQIKASFS